MVNYASFFKETFLFRGVADSELRELTEGLTVEKRYYKKGDVIYSPEIFEEKIGFVYSGDCQVSRPSVNGASVPLNLLGRTDSFGIITVFSRQADFPTAVIAKNESTVLFLQAQDVLNLVKKNTTVALNVINFLTERIAFLNDKISAFSGGTVEKKLASYILSIAKRRSDSVFDFNKKRSAEALNCGRASLYRAMNSLEESGCVKFVDKKIYILDLEGLERMSK